MVEVKDVALVYGSQWLGKGVVTAIDMYVPDATQRLIVKGLLSALPAINWFVDLSDAVQDFTLSLGGYVSTSLLN